MKFNVVMYSCFFVCAGFSMDSDHAHESIGGNLSTNKHFVEHVKKKGKKNDFRPGRPKNPYIYIRRGRGFGMIDENTDSCDDYGNSYVTPVNSQQSSPRDLPDIPSAKKIYMEHMKEDLSESRSVDKVLLKPMDFSDSYVSSGDLEELYEFNL